MTNVFQTDWGHKDLNIWLRVSPRAKSPSYFKETQELPQKCEFIFPDKYYYSFLKIKVSSGILFKHIILSDLSVWKRKNDFCSTERKASCKVCLKCFITLVLDLFENNIFASFYSTKKCKPEWEVWYLLKCSFSKFYSFQENL